MIYDIIGDIHGNADKLIDLFECLEYNLVDGVYQRPGHVAVFVGDLIDRGPEQRRVLEIVQPLVLSGKAHAIMGNHEYNAICYHTPTPRANDRQWLRPHTKSKCKQHQSFLKEFPLGCDETNKVIEWFKTLPVYLDLGFLRVIHACWDQSAINLAHESGLFTVENTINLSKLTESATEGTVEFEIIERLLKGPELKGILPFFDKDGHPRHEIRTRWWGEISDESTYKDLAFWYDSKMVDIPDKCVGDVNSLPKYHLSLPPVFFGHYWLNHELKIQQSNVCCLDYSAGTTGPLVAYRFDSEKSTSALSKNTFYCSR